MDESRIVLVTGASSGIGRACAALLHKRGYVVYGTSRKADAAAPWRMLQMDVRVEASVNAGVARIVAEQGRIDVVVNNAGLVLAGSIEDTTVEEARDVLETNLLGAHRVIRAALPPMRARRAGLFVNVGSLAGVVGLPFQGFYSASKFALEGFTEALRLELKPFNIEACVIEPGDIATGVVQNRVRAAGSGAASPYVTDFSRVLAAYEKDESAGAAPEIVARRILSVIETRRPGVRYSVGAIAQRALASLKPFLPATWFERGFMIFYGIRRA